MKARSRSIHLSVHIHKDPAAMAEREADEYDDYDED